MSACAIGGAGDVARNRMVLRQGGAQAEAGAAEAAAAQVAASAATARQQLRVSRGVAIS